MPSFRWDDGIGPGLDFGLGEDDALGTMEEAAGRVRDHAQQYAPWEDRTGEAREGLDTEVYEEDGELVLELFHTVDHGLWLEVIQSGRFAIIMPTLEVYASEIFEATGASLVGGF